VEPPTCGVAMKCQADGGLSGREVYAGSQVVRDVLAEDKGTAFTTMM
jgi:hypothetical protein